jgi:hypothetical protein
MDAREVLLTVLYRGFVQAKNLKPLPILRMKASVMVKEYAVIDELHCNI